MLKKQFISQVAQHAGVSPKLVNQVYTSLVAVVRENVATMQKSTALPGLVTFHYLHRLARRGTNPRTGEIVNLPAKTVVKANILSALKK